MIGQSKAIIFFHCPYESHYILSDQCKFTCSHWWACNMYEYWAVLRMKDRYPLVINPGIYSLALWFSRFSKKSSWHITVILRFFKKSENQSKNHESAEGFEITGTGGSLILNFFPNNQKRQFFKSSKNCPTLVCTSRALRQVSISNFSNYQMRVFRTVAKIRQLVSKMVQF